MSKISEIEALKRKEKYLEVINSFALILFDAQSIEEIVWSVTKHAMAKLNYYDCVIYLYNKDENKLIQYAAFGPKNPQKEEIKDPIKLSPGEGIVGQVFSSGKGEYVNDTSKDPRYVVDDERRYSEITVPLTYNDEVVGVIDSEHPEKNFFTDQDFDLLTTVAAMVSTKIAQAKANEELLNYQENLEALVEEKTSKLKAQNREKELLMKEMHHRVKNNMQIMISLLNLQMNTTEDEEKYKHLREFQDRIRSMAIIHERLYLEDDFNHITIDAYFHELVESLFASIGLKEGIKLKQKIAPIQLHLDYAIPLGLILNEMMTNTLKHAFEDLDGAEISIELNQKEDHQLEFLYSDNGKGFDPTINHAASFGSELIDILVDQIDGKMSRNTLEGVRYRINFSTQKSF